MNVDSETAPFRKWILRWWSVLALFRYNLSISEKKESTKTKYLWSFSFQLHSAHTAYGHRISNSTEPVANKFKSYPLPFIARIHMLESIF